MNKILLLLLLAATACNSCFAQAKPKAPVTAQSETLTNSSIIALHGAGLSDDLILSKLASSAAKLDLSTNGLVELKKQGLSDRLISAMFDKGNGVNVSKTSSVVSLMPTVKTQADADFVPEMMNVPYHSGKPIEKTVATSRMKRKALGLGGIDIVFEIKLAKSPARITQNDNLSFIVNTGGGSLPEMTLYHLTADGGKRYATVTKVDPMGTARSGTDIATFNATVVKQGIFKISVSQKLAPGEYFFANKSGTNAGTATTAASSIDVFAFGID